MGQYDTFPRLASRSKAMAGGDPVGRSLRASLSRASLLSTRGRPQVEKGHAMQPLSDAGSTSSGSDSDDHEAAQAGVLRLEAVSATWSKWALIVAYAG